MRAAAGHLALVAVAVLYFWPATLGGLVFFERDIHLQWYGQAHLIGEAFRSGAWPLWTDAISFGQPLLGNPNQQTLYPTTWLLALVSPHRYYTWFVVAHVALFGSGLAFLSRRLGASARAALAVGAMGMLGGPLLSMGNIINHLGGAAWIPWIAWAGFECASDPRPKTAVRWGLLVALQSLMGSIDMCVVALAVTLALLPAVPRLDGRRLVTAAALAAATAFGAAALQWIPSFDLLAASGGRALQPGERGFWSMTPWSAVEVLVPLQAERVPLSHEGQALLVGPRERLLSSPYLGLPVVLLAGLGVLASPRRLWALGVASILALLYAMGPMGPVFDAVQHLVPPLRVLRFPSKALALPAACIPLLAAFGLDGLRETRGRARALVAGAAGVVLAMLLAGLLRWPPDFVAALVATDPARVAGLRISGLDLDASADAAVPAAVLADARSRLLLAGVAAGTLALAGIRRIGGPAALAVVSAAAVVDLALVHTALNPMASPSLLTSPSPAVEELRKAPGRTWAYDYFTGWPETFGPPPRNLPTPPTWSPSVVRAAAMRSYATPPVTVTWDVDGSYDSDRLGLFPVHLSWINSAFFRSLGDASATRRFLEIGAVSRVATFHTAGLGALQPIAAVPSLVTLPVLIWQVPAPVPRAYAVGRSRLVGDGDMERELKDGAFDPHREVLLASGPERHSEEFEGSARVVARRADRVVVEATLSSPGFVVLVDTFNAGWKPRVDGRPVPLLRANGAFQAVPVDAGAHRIELVFRPWSVVVGAALTLGTLAVATAVLVAGRGGARA